MARTVPIRCQVGQPCHAQNKQEHAIWEMLGYDPDPILSIESNFTCKRLQAKLLSATLEVLANRSEVLAQARLAWAQGPGWPRARR